jgi:alpha-L-rhamnosidase
MRQLFFLLAALGMWIPGQVKASEVPAPSGLMVELLTRPDLTQITNPAPGFSWIVNSAVKNDVQTAFQIVVADAPSKLSMQENLTWDSGKVLSSQSTSVNYAGKPLASFTSYWWMVRTWNGAGEISGWSAPQQFNTGDFGYERKWPGESRWVQIKGPDGGMLWTFENRHPISYHNFEPVKTTAGKGRIFYDFGRAAFAAPEIEYEYHPEANRKQPDTLWIHLGEKAVGDSIDQEPGGGVIFRRYPFVPLPGSHTGMLELPRFVPRYPHSQSMPAHMPEVIPFRYVEVLAGSPAITVKNVVQRALYYQFDEEASRFSCSDQRLNDIYNLCRYSAKVNTFNGDYAASQRERMMYEADCYIHQMSHYAIDREFAIARYSLENMIFHATWPTEWIFHTILMAYADYQHSGNTDILRKYFDELSAKLMLPLASDNYLVSTKTGKQTPDFLKSIHFNGKELRDIVDWPHGGMGLVETGGETDNFDFREYNSVVNAFHYKALTAMSEMAAAVGKSAESVQYRQRAALVKNSFNKAFFSRERGIYLDGIGSEHASLHANMFALTFGLVEDASKPKVIEYIKSRGMACGVYGANYLLEGLFNEHQGEYAMQLLTSDSDRSWLNMLRVGSTMTTEAWDNKYKSNNGWSHAWSSSPAHIIHRKIMGIEPLEPGFGKIRIKPQPSGLTTAEVRHPTIRGAVLVSFQNQEGESFSLDVTIPANTTAEVYLPFYDKNQQVRQNGQPVDYRQSGNYAVVGGVGSGRSSFEVVKR